VAASNDKENRGRVEKQYLPGDQVLIVMVDKERRGHPKMSAPTKGPHTVTQVHTNGTVQINRGNFVEAINIRHLKPYFS
jgi:hypothetical protein